MLHRIETTVRKFSKTCFLIAIISACYGTSVNADQTSITLSDALDATMQNQLSEHFAGDIRTQNRLNWIDGAPIVSMRYYHNQTELGSKEAELSLSVPIKSSFKKQIEESLKSSSVTIKNNATRQLALHYSGILRDVIWQYREQTSQLRLATRKQAILARLLEKYRNLAELNALPRYAFQLLQKEVNSSRILSLEYEYSTQQLLNQYSTISGLQSLPKHMEEDLPAAVELMISKHPNIQSLDAAWAAQGYSLKGQTQSSEPWNVHISARRIETFDFSENQLGVGLDIPISSGQGLSVSQQNEYRQAQINYEVERNKLLVDILAAAQSSQAKYQFLASKQVLLEESLPTLKALESSINHLLDSNTQDHATHIRNLIDLLEAQAEVELNRMAIQRQIAMIRQAVGLSL